MGETSMAMTMASHIEKLPCETLFKIFNEISTKDLCSFANTCTLYKGYVENYRDDISYKERCVTFNILKLCDQKTRLKMLM